MLNKSFKPNIKNSSMDKKIEELKEIFDPSYLKYTICYQFNPIKGKFLPASVRPEIETGTSICFSICTDQGEVLFGKKGRSNYLPEAKVMEHLKKVPETPNVSVIYRDEREMILLTTYHGVYDLEKYMSSRKSPLSPQTKRTLCLNVIDAIEKCHGKRVLHRDTKPENIRLNSTGEIHLVDFGLSRILQAGEQVYRDHSIKIHGTPHYFPPERWFRFSGYQDDVFSLGSVLYFILTDGKDLCGVSPSEFSIKWYYQWTRNTEKTIRNRTDLGPNLKDILVKATSFCLHKRTSSVTEVREAIEKIDFESELI